MPKSLSVKPSIIIVKREVFMEMLNDPEWSAKLEACLNFAELCETLNAYAISRNLKVKKVIINE